MAETIRWTMKELESKRDKEYKETFGIDSFTHSLSVVLDIPELHGFLMEWAEAIHNGDKVESAFCKGRILGIIYGLDKARELKQQYRNGTLFDYFEKFATDWGHDDEYWFEEGE